MRVETPQIPRSLVGPPQRGNGLNLTVLVFFAALAVFALSTSGYLLRLLPAAAAAVLNGLSLYALYTVNHEAVHQLAHPNRVINEWLGRISAALEGISFPMFKILHLQHHAHTNHRERDPDYVIGRQPRWLLPMWVFVRLTHDNYFMIRRRLWARRRPQLFEHLATLALQMGVVLFASVTGHLTAAAVIWLVPVVVAGASIELTVAWLVHFPHESDHPLESTRMFHGRLWQLLTFNQNYHLVHHLWPGIPWFRYREAAGAAQDATRRHADSNAMIRDLATPNALTSEYENRM